MKSVDYGPIAATYDDLPIRNQVAPDPRLATTLERHHGRGARVLDVGCGTGTWLAAQAEHFGGEREVSWFGIDPSEAMLARARAKLPVAALAIASAEALPFADESFAFVATRFAYHHFEDKPRALGELCRVLASDGELLLENVDPEQMPGWWVFHWFPEARADNARYWPAEQLRQALAASGLVTSVELRRSAGTLSLAQALEQASVRDQSHLVTLDDAAYARGLAALADACARDPSGSTPTETAVVTLRAVAPPVLR